MAEVVSPKDSEPNVAFSETLKVCVVPSWVSPPEYVPSVSKYNFTLFKFVLATTVPLSVMAKEVKMPVADAIAKVKEPPTY